MPVSIDDKQVLRLIDRLLVWGKSDIVYPINEAANEIRAELTRNFFLGKDINGVTMNYIDSKTVDMPIKYGDPYKDLRKRGDVNPSQIPMTATGRTRDSLTAQKVSNTEYNVGYNDERSAIILESNAKGNSNVSKPKRDPVGLNERNPSKKEFDIVVDEIEKALDRLLNGI